MNENEIELAKTKEGISDSEKIELIDIQNENIKSNLDDFMIEANSNLKERFGEDFADLKVSDNQTLGDLSDMLEKKAGAYAEDNGLIFSKDESGQTVLENQRTSETFSDFDSAKAEIIKTIEDDFSNMKDEKSLTVDAVFERANGKDETLDERVQSLNGNASQESSVKEVEVQGDHTTIKESTMAGEASERVVSRESGLDELDKTAGKDSDKVEIKEEHERRDGLSAAEEDILKTINADRHGSLNDAIDEYKSDSSNSEVSISQGQNNSESSKQK